ncbi:MAG: bacillithiol biosynthesis cysteine-adding enzyme BshC [Acidobacteria bacterium]|nr:MAG: bacillithiol biosynthesis cysteine-adding enzyme BshC [Acidobacteriota bacterium]
MGPVMRLYNDQAMAERPGAILDYGAFQHPPSRLFRDYVAGTPSVRPFYEGARWDLEAAAAAAQATSSFAHPRAALAETLARQQEALGAEGAAAQARRLGQPETAALVTGQQAVLFGGPLYVLYKAVAAMKVARLLAERSGRPVVPVFWVASDDHDFAEVRSVSVLDDAGQIVNIRYAPEREPAGEPAARIVLDSTITALVEDLGRALPAGLNRDGLLARLAECYRPGATLSGAFARFLSSLLPDLVVLDPSDPALKSLMLPVMTRELQEGSPTSRLADQRGQELLAAGYHQQVPVRPGFLNLFLHADGQRRALAFEDSQIEVRGTGRRFRLEEALRHLQTQAAEWSPGVLLRPLAQDLMLPTAAYVGGPAEVAYHAQIVPSYAHFGIPRPALMPRPSLTLVEPSQARALEAEGLTLPDLQEDPQAILGRWVRESYPEIETAFARVRDALEREMAGVETALGALDPTLRGAADSARGRILHQIEGLQEKATRALKKRDQVRADRLRRTRDALLPGGSFQERGLGLVSVIARHGEGIVSLIGERMDPWARGHQVVYL